MSFFTLYNFTSLVCLCHEKPEQALANREQQQPQVTEGQFPLVGR